MSGTLPTKHIIDAQKLDEAESYIELFFIQLREGQQFYLKNDNSGTWNGLTWEGLACKLTGTGSYADSQVARPKFQCQNPDALFSPFIAERALDGAFLTRYRVLLSDFVANNLIYVSQIWYVGRVSSLSRSAFILELRDFGDAPNQVIPALTFSPPKFASVSVR